MTLRPPSPGEEAGSRSTRTTLLLIAVLAAAAALRLHGLGGQSFWIDEVFSIRDAREPLHEILVNGWFLWSGTEVQHTTPLYFLLLHAVLQFTSAEFWTRLPSVVVSVADVGVLYLLGRELFDRRVGLTAAGLLALSPLHVWYAQDVRWYAALSLLVTLSYLAFVYAWRGGGGRRWAAYAASAVASVYTSILAWTALAAQGLSSLWLGTGRSGVRWRRLGAFSLALAATAVLAYPNLLSAVPFLGAGEAPTVGTPRPFLPESLPYTFFAFVAGYSLGPTLAELHSLPSARWIVTNHPEVLLYAALFVPLFLLGLRKAWEHRFARAVLLPAAVGIPLLVLLSSAVSGTTYNVRYAVFALPAFTLVLGLGLGETAERFSPGAAWAAGAAAAVLFALSLSNHYWDTRYHKADVREAVQTVGASERAEAPVFVAGQVTAAAEFYVRRADLPGRVETVVACDADRNVVRTDRSDYRDDRPDALWLLAGRDWDGETARCLRELTSTHEIREAWSPPGVELFLLKRPEGESGDGAGGRSGTSAGEE